MPQSDHDYLVAWGTVTLGEILRRNVGSNSGWYFTSWLKILHLLRRIFLADIIADLVCPPVAYGPRIFGDWYETNHPTIIVRVSSPVPPIPSWPPSEIPGPRGYLVDNTTNRDDSTLVGMYHGRRRKRLTSITTTSCMPVTPSTDSSSDSPRSPQSPQTPTLCWSSSAHPPVSCQPSSQSYAYSSAVSLPIFCPTPVMGPPPQATFFKEPPASPLPASLYGPRHLHHLSPPERRSPSWTPDRWPPSPVPYSGPTPGTFEYPPSSQPFDPPRVLGYDCQCNSCFRTEGNSVDKCRPATSFMEAVLDTFTPYAEMSDPRCDLDEVLQRLLTEWYAVGSCLLAVAG